MRVRASHILVKSEARAQKLIDDLKLGADFATLAKQYSECPSKEKGGDLGQFGPGQMVQPFESVSFGLEVGAISAPVQTQFGFHVIKRTE